MPPASGLDWNDQLFARYLAGDQYSFSELHARLNPSLLSLVKSRGRLDANAADEVCQRTWIDVAACAHWPADAPNFRHYLFSVAVRHSLAYTLAAIADALAARELGDVLPQRQPPEPADELIAADWNAALVKAATLLDENEAAVVQVVYYDGLTIDAAAERLGVSARKVDFLIASAKEKIVRAFLSP